VGGWTGALLATLGIFLPAFFFVWLTHPLIARLRRSASLSALLDGVTVASLGLMAAVTLRLGQAALTDAVTVALALVALAVLLRWRVNSAWLVLAGGVAGIVWRGLP
jgi:chromate transporter